MTFDKHLVKIFEILTFSYTIVDEFWNEIISLSIEIIISH